MKIVAGTFKHRKINAPKSDAVRPTSERLRESLFDICQGYIQDAAFLDLFAGSGAMGLEAISRGAKSATFIDNNRESIRCIQQNVENLGIKDQTQVFSGDVFEAIAKLSQRGKVYGIIYADPPYDSWKNQKGQLVSYSRHLLELIDKSSLLIPSGLFFIEESVDAAPEELELTTLKLLSSRRLGRSILQEYMKDSLT